MDEATPMRFDDLRMGWIRYIISFAIHSINHVAGAVLCVAFRAPNYRTFLKSDRGVVFRN